MKALNNKAAKQLMRQLDKQDGTERAIDFHPKNSLRIEKLNEVITAEGEGRIYRIGVLAEGSTSTFSTLMDFVVVDRRGIEAEPGPLFIYPIRYKDDVNDVEEVSVPVTGRRLGRCNPQLQLSHVNHAYKWLIDLHTDGYFK